MMILTYPMGWAAEIVGEMALMFLGFWFTNTVGSLFYFLGREGIFIVNWTAMIIGGFYQWFIFMPATCKKTVNFLNKLRNQDNST